MPNEDQRTEIALFRYTLIVPLLRGEYPPGGKEACRRQIAAAAGPPPHSERATISASTLARWERCYRQRGFDGLKPRPRADRGRRRALSDATLDRAETLKREQPRRSARSIIAILTRDTTTPLPEDHLAPRTLRRGLAARNATTAQLLRTQRPQPYRRFERRHFGDLWQGDAMDGPALPDPAAPARTRPTFLFAFLDDHTRLVVHAQFYWNEQLPRLEDCFKRALLRYGRPQAIYVDRGPVNVSRQLDTACATLGIQRILGTAYYPEGRGKIERFFQFVQSDFLPELAHAAVTTLPQLNESLLAWIEVVYHRKLHRETGQAPLERFRQDSTPSTRPADPQELRAAFRHREKRQVTKTATVSFRGNRYRVPAFLRGQTIELRYDPFDLAQIEVYFRDTFIAMAEVERLVTTVHPAVTPDPAPVPPPDSGVDYLALLRLERERLLQAQLEGIHFTRLTAAPAQPQEQDRADPVD
jgi:putative transposase